MSLFSVDQLRSPSFGPISFSLTADQCITISGASGSGKSLLLRSLADLDPHQGKIFLNEVEHMSIPAPQWRKQVALLPTKPSWWYDTVGEHFTHFDNIRLNALGFETDVWNWSIERLSSGEQQRLALLRILINQPLVLLLDEPTASLDPDNTQKVEQLVMHYKKSRPAAIIWVSHDLEQVRRISQQHFIMADGLIRPSII